MVDLERSKHRRATGVLVSALLLITACNREATPTSASLVEVGIVEVEPQPAQNLIEVPGRVQAFRTAEVRARVDGIVERRLFDEGTDVHEGQPMFRIDPRELRANLTAAEAALARAQATAANAAQDVERYKSLVAKHAISAQDYDTAVAKLREARADLAQMKARRDSAQLSLSYTDVTAPIAGRAGRAQVTEGALVSASSATLLTTIEQLDPVYVNFSQSSAEILKVRGEIRRGSLDMPPLQQVAVSLLLEDGHLYSKPGHLDFFASVIDAETGTAGLRAEFPNPDHVLLPGQFVRARIEAGVRSKAMLIPQRAVVLTRQGAHVNVVGADDIVAERPVKVGDLSGDSWTIVGGLEPGDRVIVDGLQKVQAGEHVKVSKAESPHSDAAQLEAPLETKPAQ